jgi:hypothetical protein
MISIVVKMRNNTTIYFYFGCRGKLLGNAARSRSASMTRIIVETATRHSVATSPVTMLPFGRRVLAGFRGSGRI